MRNLPTVGTPVADPAAQKTNDISFFLKKKYEENQTLHRKNSIHDLSIHMASHKKLITTKIVFPRT